LTNTIQGETALGGTISAYFLAEISLTATVVDVFKDSQGLFVVIYYQ
jgi:hypothetical protein